MLGIHKNYEKLKEQAGFIVDKIQSAFSYHTGIFLYTRKIFLIMNFNELIMSIENMLIHTI